MTKVIIRKIIKKAAAQNPLYESARAKRFKDLAIEHGARNLEAKIDQAINESDERRKRVKKAGSVTVAVS
ncbi:hypothetical protein BN2475_10004 [Paraburkholderia ribeironis]|uniref:Uncharacterized protein n=1 Tax=Paraburkholderia ribeironis TaxID=1247936 RepID=A0A1N7RI57_9BURK|nr:hypothetical protein [Paraburkholderia ribeironis]SIT34848.1 hypothetical protein BN2475_10004 [Paraburkholderia ribeironis]